MIHDNQYHVVITTAVISIIVVGNVDVVCERAQF